MSGPLLRSAGQKARALTATAEASLWLTLAWLTLDVLPGKLYRKLIPTAQPAAAQSTDPDAPIPSPPRIEDLRTTVRRTVRAIQRVNRVFPFRCVCFHRGIAAHHMLRRQSLETVMHYGIARNAEDGALKAHVWVTHRGIDVVGGPESEGYTEVARFLDPASVSLRP